MRHRRRILGKKMRHRRRILDPRRRGEVVSRLVVRSGARLRGGKVPRPRLLHRRLLWSVGRTGGGPSLKKRRGRPHVSSLKRRDRPHVFGGLCLGRTEAPMAKRLSASAGGSRSASSLPEPICRVEAGWGRIKGGVRAAFSRERRRRRRLSGIAGEGVGSICGAERCCDHGHSIAGVAPAGSMPGHLHNQRATRQVTSRHREREGKGGAGAPLWGERVASAPPFFDESELEHGV